MTTHKSRRPNCKKHPQNREASPEEIEQMCFELLEELANPAEAQLSNSVVTDLKNELQNNKTRKAGLHIRVV